jgi:hypothetical protein
MSQLKLREKYANNLERKRLSSTLVVIYRVNEGTDISVVVH